MLSDYPATAFRDQSIELPVWTLINGLVIPKTSDSYFWWRTTGTALAILLQRAGYSSKSQCRHLLFYYRTITPELGAEPNANGTFSKWKSFMTDNFSPIELSWEWGRGSEAPTVRYSIEPIGPLAGTTSDPLNQYATSRLLDRLQPAIPNCDLTLFKHFSEKLVSYTNNPILNKPELDREGHLSRTFVAFDLGREVETLKVYFIPTFKASELSISPWTLVAQAIESLPGYSSSAYPSLPALQSFMASSTFGSSLRTEIFAVDCVAPVKSRLKIYMRTQATSFSSVREIMTLGARLQDPGIDRGLHELQSLMDLILTDASQMLPSENLPIKNHRTAGFLYYFDIKHGAVEPGVKIYIPVRHYGKSDLAIVKGLESYLKGRGQEHLANMYLEALRTIASPDTLKSGLGVQTYLGCSIVGDQPKLTSYLCPNVHPS